MANAVYIVDGMRTPFLKAKMRGAFSASDLATLAASATLRRQGVSVGDCDEVVVGCVMPSEREANIARLLALRLGGGEQVPAWTVSRNCASGLQSIDAAFTAIASGRSNLVLAGGCEAMSHAPLLWQAQLAQWLMQWPQCRTLLQKISHVAALRPHMFKPVSALLHGLTDPLHRMGMGQTAEKCAQLCQIDRRSMDEFALQSHQRAAAAEDAQFFDSHRIVIHDKQGQVYDRDTGVRANGSLEQLERLKPIFDRPYGQVTAGNSSQITDGAAMLLLASEQACAQYGLTPKAVIRDIQWAGVDPTIMGLGPVPASSALLQRHQLTLEDINCWEINEAFSAQVLACLAAMKCPSLCQQYLNGCMAHGAIDPATINAYGGAIALGHPVGASGARIVLQLMHTLSQQQQRRGVATLCVGGGQGGAVLIEREN